MNSEQFNKIIRYRIDKIQSVLTAKADEYARGDRLSNFKQIAKLMNTTPEKVLGGLVAKHIVALYDFIDDLDRNLLQDYSRWDEKIGDIINYMVLLDALIEDRNK